MARNFSRSSSGQCGSAASSRTRALNASQDSSRLKYSDGSLGFGRAPADVRSGWVMRSLVFSLRSLPGNGDNRAASRFQ